MNTDRWIAIAAVAATLLAGFIGPMLSAWFAHYLQTRKPKVRSAEEAGNQPVLQQEASHQRVRIRWVVRLILFLIQAMAIFLLYKSTSSPTTLTHVSVVMIAVYVSIVALCIALNWVIAAYESIEAVYGYIYATADAIRYDMGMQEKRTQQHLRNSQR
jgi:NADH:ubiquinone oxidoreductase subunit 3 (subunit A)